MNADDEKTIGMTTNDDLKLSENIKLAYVVIPAWLCVVGVFLFVLALIVVYAATLQTERLNRMDQEIKENRRMEQSELNNLRIQIEQNFNEKIHVEWKERNLLKVDVDELKLKMAAKEKR